MDIVEIKSRVIILRTMLIEHGIHFDGAILFGSRAKGTHGPDSDIDLAIVSSSYGKDRFAESSLLNRLANRVIPMCDAHPVGLHEYLNPKSISPILYEIKKYGTPLL